MTDFLRPDQRRLRKQILGDVEIPEDEVVTEPKERKRADHSRFIELWNDGTPVRVMAAMLKTSESYVYNKASNLREQGHEMELRRVRNRHHWPRIKRYREQGLNGPQIAKKLRIPYESVKKAEQKMRQADE